MTRFIKTRQGKSAEKNHLITANKSSQKENPSQINTKNRTKRKCAYYKCGKDAIGSYSVDLDISGIPYCKKHKSDVSSSLLWAIFGIMEMSNHALGFPKNSKKKK